MAIHPNNLITACIKCWSFFVIKFKDATTILWKKICPRMQCYILHKYMYIDLHIYLWQVSMPTCIYAYTQKHMSVSSMKHGLW